jgi:hypothetical protein
MNYRTHLNALACAVLIFNSVAIQAEEVVSSEQIESRVALQNIHVDGQALRGQVVNKTDHRLEDVRLLIAYNWLWRNERNPGAQSPAWATTTVLAEPLNPNEVHDFTYEPERAVIAGADGEFHPAVKVIGFTEYSPPADQ